MTDKKEEKLKLINYPFATRARKNTMMWQEVVANALKGEVVMYATPKGNVMVVEEMKFQSMTTKPTTNSVVGKGNKE